METQYQWDLFIRDFPITWAFRTVDPNREVTGSNGYKPDGYGSDSVNIHVNGGEEYHWVEDLYRRAPKIRKVLVFT